jgi:flagella basal body P-ring formation protein FlgA
MRLSDVVMVQSSQKSYSSQLGRIPIPPLSEKPAVLSPDTVKKAINEHVKVTAIIVGGAAVYVPSGFTRNEQAVYTTLLKQLKNRMTPAIYRIEAVIIDRLNGSNYTEDIETVTISDEGIEKTVIAAVTVHALAATAVRDLRYKERLKPSDIEYKQRSFSMDEAEALFYEKEDITQFSVIGFVPKGTALKRHHIQKTTLVRAGKPVTILHSKNSITLKLRGQAYQSGTKGEVISVKPSHARDTLQARVISDGEVIVEVQ